MIVKSKYRVGFILWVVILLAACGSVSTPVTPVPTITPALETAAPLPSNTPNPATATHVPAASMLPRCRIISRPSAYHWAPVISGMASPVDIQFPDDGSGRMFIIEQDGRIRIIENGQILDLLSSILFRKWTAWATSRDY